MKNEFNNIGLNMKEKERILLLTDIPPCSNYTGGIMISQMIRFLLEEHYSVDCFCAMSNYLEPKMDLSVMEDINIEVYDRPEENLESSGKSKIIYYFSISKLKRKFINYIKKHNIKKVWCIIQGEVITNLVNEIKKKTDANYVVQIWDPIEWWIKEHKFDEQRRNKVLKDYEIALINASYCMTTSFAMRKEYEEKYKIKCIEVMPPLESKHYDVDCNKKDKSKFIVAISGQIYAKEETDALLSALEKLNWKYNDKDIVFHYYGQWSDNYIDLKKYNHHRNNIIINGFLPQYKLLQELSYVDLLYCPYFFSSEDSLRRVSTLSFPSKLISYMSLEVPILIHAPKYASPYVFLVTNKAAFLLDTMNVDKIVEKIKKIISVKEEKRKEIVKNANKAFENHFTFEIVKNNFYKALDLPYSKEKKLRILEVNNVDLPGRRFNGFDLQQMINSDTIHNAKQIVTYKTSDNSKVLEFYNNNKLIELEVKLIANEAKFLSVHSQLSMTSNILYNHDEFIHSDLVHYHLIHNTKLSLYKMIDLCNAKPTVITIHDLWNFTGRCVYPQECEDWKNGCEKCNYLNNLFALKDDNCHSLWKLKEKIYKNLDVDIVVSTPYMMNLVKTSPLTKHFKHLHLIPFGIDLNKFSNSISREEARKKLNINNNDIVLFFRAQMAMKGTEYIIEALKELDIDKKITLLTCSEKDLLNELKNKYDIIDLGHIEDDDMIIAYNACDIFLMPSRSESFGLMAIEAMACSRPIIIFDNTALPYVTFAPECGVLVENKNSHELMKAIKRLCDDKKERERRGKLGRKLAVENYDINVYHQKILKLYEEAYNRQKNKKTICNEKVEIDYSLPDVQLLIKKLVKVFYHTFPQKSKLKTEFMKHKIKSDIIISKKIDYSNINVQLVIEQFNDYIYNLIKVENTKKEYVYKNKSIIIKFLYLLKHDREKLKHTIKYRLRNHKILYKIIHSFYGTMRVIKKILVNKK